MIKHKSRIFMYPLSLFIICNSEHPLECVPFMCCTVPGKHCCIEATPTCVLDTDLGSTNGTNINGALLSANPPTPLKHGAELSLGGGGREGGVTFRLAKDGVVPCGGLGNLFAGLFGAGAVKQAPEEDEEEEMGADNPLHALRSTP
jgi:hypothetical protein